MYDCLNDFYICLLSIGWVFFWLGIVLGIGDRVVLDGVNVLVDDVRWEKKWI